MVTLNLSWPSAALWQNSRVHWSERSRAIKALREEAHATALEACIKSAEIRSPVLTFTFNPPDRKHRDLHNLPATQKAAIDGIADAFEMDDRTFQCVWPTEFGKVVPHGRVVIEVTSEVSEDHVKNFMRLQKIGSAYQISSGVGGPISTVQRILHSLDDQGFLTMRNGFYKLSVAAEKGLIR